MNTKMKIGIIAVLVLSLAACTKSDGDGGDGGGQLSGDCALKIINGEACPKGEGPVAMLLSEDSKGKPAALCSGTFIARNKVITAAHCAELFLSPTVKVMTGSKSVRATGIKIHPSYNPVMQFAFKFDVGIVTLAENVDITPLPLLLSRQIVAGDSVYVYGFGLDENGKTAVDKDYGNSAERTKMVVSEVGQGGIIAEFDTTHSGACEGDSGGPAIAKSNGGSWGIAGVVSGGTTTTCKDGTIEVFVQLDRQVIIDFISGEVPDYGAV